MITELTNLGMLEPDADPDPIKNISEKLEKVYFKIISNYLQTVITANKALNPEDPKIQWLINETNAFLYILQTPMPLPSNLFQIHSVNTWLAVAAALPIQIGLEEHRKNFLTAAMKCEQILRAQFSVPNPKPANQDFGQHHTCGQIVGSTQLKDVTYATTQLFLGTGVQIINKIYNQRHELLLHATYPVPVTDQSSDPVRNLALASTVHAYIQLGQERAKVDPMTFQMSRYKGNYIALTMRPDITSFVRVSGKQQLKLNLDEIIGFDSQIIWNASRLFPDALNKGSITMHTCTA